MSRSSKEQRKKERKKVRDAKKQQYAAEAAAGKAKKAREQMEGFNPHKHSHKVHNCGNTGCRKCFPEHFKT